MHCCAPRWASAAARMRAAGLRRPWRSDWRTSTPRCARCRAGSAWPHEKAPRGLSHHRSTRRATSPREVRWIVDCFSVFARAEQLNGCGSRLHSCASEPQALGASMGAKRALIVDDSKSARLFLARVLEKYDIDVDAAENAEAAIDYLTNNRPDVIFMDHMMPGMDGLQAVQAIKNDPRTATIPIMMYTSQEGELYLGQARALGAVGVLPKQIKPTDVSKVLYQLHLVPDRRSSEQSTFTPVNVAADAEPGLPANAKALTDTALREHFAELRRALVAGVDTQTDRITAEVRALLLEALPPPPAEEAPPPPRPLTPQWAWIVACAALAIALLSSALWWRSVQLLEHMDAQLTQLRQRQVT